MKARADHELDAPNTVVVTSAVCTGELRALAERNGWGARKREQLERVLQHFPTIGIRSAQVQAACAMINAWTSGVANAAPSSAPPPQPARTLGQNDLWVAATARATRSALMSTDADFKHLSGIWLEFLYVPQGPPPG